MQFYEVRGCSFNDGECRGPKIATGWQGGLMHRFGHNTQHSCTKALPDKLIAEATRHKLHRGGVEPNLACHVQQVPPPGGLAIWPNAAGRPPADALHVKDSPCKWTACAHACFSASAHKSTAHFQTPQVMVLIERCICVFWPKPCTRSPLTNAGNQLSAGQADYDDYHLHGCGKAQHRILVRQGSTLPMAHRSQGPGHSVTCW